jgi:hypothetical protein
MDENHPYPERRNGKQHNPVLLEEFIIADLSSQYSSNDDDGREARAPE